MNEASTQVIRPRAEIKLTEAQIKRFRLKFQATSPDECWEWTGGLDRTGYGQTHCDYPIRSVKAHRVSYFLEHGPIPDHLCVCHRCDNRKCVNPAHLFLGTPAENSADMVVKNRSFKPKGEKHGASKLTALQVREIRSIYASGGISQRLLGLKYGIGQQSVYGIVNRQRWKHV
jgi:hypothetical protein